MHLLRKQYRSPSLAINLVSRKIVLDFEIRALNASEFCQRWRLLFLHGPRGAETDQERAGKPNGKVYFRVGPGSDQHNRLHGLNFLAALFPSHRLSPTLHAYSAPATAGRTPPRWASIGEAEPLLISIFIAEAMIPHAPIVCQRSGDSTRCAYPGLSRAATS